MVSVLHLGVHRVGTVCFLLIGNQRIGTVCVSSF